MQAPWWWSQTETCRSDIYVYFNVNFNVFFKLIKVHLLANELYITLEVQGNWQFHVESFVCAVFSIYSAALHILFGKCLINIPPASSKVFDSRWLLEKITSWHYESNAEFEVVLKNCEGEGNGVAAGLASNSLKFPHIYRKTSWYELLNMKLRV